MTDRNALIIGASRGLGLGLVGELLRRQWTVTATTRTPSDGLAAMAGPKLTLATLDIDDDDAVAALRAGLASQSFDLIFVVAGVSIGGDAEVLHKVSRDDAARVFQTNAVSPIRFAETFCGLIAKGGTLALMTSVLGSVSLNTRGTWEVYRASKAALNTLGRSFAVRHQNDGFDVVMMHPGWVRTDMGGPSATLDVETSVTGMINVLEQPSRTGCNYLDYKGDTLTW